MKKLSFILSLFLLISCSVFKKSPIEQTELVLTLPDTDEIVRTLSSDEFEGREPGSSGMKLAHRYVENFLIQAGVQPLWNSSFYDKLDLPGNKFYNLVGFIPSDSLTDDYVLIGAHLDHIGKSGYSGDSVYNGANDNATGVTAVMQIAKELNKHKLKKNVIIAIFTLEESGLLGSKHLAKKLKSQNINLSWVINFEMIGVPLKKDPGKVYISGYKVSDFASVANNLLGDEFIIYEKVDTDYGLFRMADNYPFYEQFNIPSHTVCTYAFDNYPYYHDVKDEYTQIDTNHMETIITKMTDVILKLIIEDSKITLAE